MRAAYSLQVVVGPSTAPARGFVTDHNGGSADGAAPIPKRGVRDGEARPKARAKLAAKEFGLPEKARTAEAKVETGNYPMPDAGHAISAKRLSRKQRKDGNLTKDEFERINRKADKVLRAKPKD